MLKRGLIKIFSLAGALLLAGCSGHPGAGTWSADADNNLNIAKLIVHFEGRAELIAKDDSELLRCFWAATEKTVIQMDCTGADNPDVKYRYTLTADESKGKLSTVGHPAIALTRVSP